MEARITLSYRSQKYAKAILDAVSPDNIKTPKNLLVKTIRKNNRVSTSIIYEGENIMTFLSTINDFLSCVSAAEKSLSAVKKMRKMEKLQLE